jgi:NAD(P)-dependent dehydrogenase (short-subunit alcohol dehydrogenase family)
MAKVVVTGANRGIGLEFCRQLRARGDAVVAACRRSSEGLAELGVQVVEGIDVGSEPGARALHAALGSERVDVLINNAGIMRRDELGRLDWGSLREQIEVDAVGPLRVTQALLGNLKRGAKIAMITSRMGSIGDNTSGGFYGYRMAKAALNMAAVSLAVDLREKGIAVAILHPGYVRTDMTRGQGSVEPIDSVAGMLARIDALTPATSGKFWLYNGDTLPW